MFMMGYLATLGRWLTVDDPTTYADLFAWRERQRNVHIHCEGAD